MSKLLHAEWLNSARIGITGLKAHKFRAALSMLGIVFGVGSVVAVIAVSEGARGEVMKQLAAMGANNIMVTGIDWRTGSNDTRDLKKRTRLRSVGLTARGAEAAFDVCPLLDMYAPVKKVRAAVRTHETPMSVEVIGTTPDFIGVMAFKIREGAWFNADDQANAHRVCVLEDAVCQEYFPLASPMGQTVIIDHEPYDVIGVLQGKEASNSGGGKTDVADIKQLNRRIYIPLKAALMHTTQEPLADEVSEVIFRCRASADIRPAAQLLSRFYESAHNMQAQPPEERDFKVRIAQELIKQTEDSQKIFNYVMMCSAGISLLVGGIGIMNIMLANVTERRREVGTRRAVGARQRDIVSQFLAESLSICLIGGILGCLMGVLFACLVEYQTGWVTTIAPWSMFAAMGVSLLDGVIFGTYPAYKAGKLDPIEALRYE